MTIEKAKELLPIIQAFVDGKTIQFLSDKGKWIDIDGCDIIFTSATNRCRIKPEPTYRPFNTREERWQEMLKHQPFGWIKSKDKGYFYLIGLVQLGSKLEGVMITFAASEQLARSSRSLFEKYIFADGTPFGIKEE